MFNNISNKKVHDNGVVTFTRQHDFSLSHSLISFHSFGCGWGNAYVAIPVNHPFCNSFIPTERIINKYGNIDISYYEIPPIEEQEWTFSEKGELPGDTTEYYVFGFDTLHSWNNMENSSEEKVVRIIENYVPVVNSYCK